MEPEDWDHIDNLTHSGESHANFDPIYEGFRTYDIIIKIVRQRADEIAGLFNFTFRTGREGAIVFFYEYSPDGRKISYEKVLGEKGSVRSPGRPHILFDIHTHPPPLRGPARPSPSGPDLRAAAMCSILGVAGVLSAAGDLYFYSVRNSDAILRMGSGELDKIARSRNSGVRAELMLNVFELFSSPARFEQGAMVYDGQFFVPYSTIKKRIEDITPRPLRSLPAVIRTPSG